MPNPSRTARPRLAPTLLVSVALAACGGDAPPRFSAQPAAPDPVALSEPVRPLPPAPELDPARVALGRRLFHDPLLSADGTVSCASCHHLERGGGDARRFSPRVGGSRAPVNTPTVLNASLHFRWGWDGRASSLAEQTERAGHDEMGIDLDGMARRVRGDAALAAELREVYGTAGKDEVVDALVAFQRSLLTPSRFDRYLAGATEALDPSERQGYDLFKRLGCAACHQGAGVGGNMFQRFGILGDYFGDRGDPTDADLGRFNVTGRAEDRHVFKVPSLRNVARTAPYFHDGSVDSLEDAIRVMGRYQLGRELPPEEVHRLTAFLRTLDAEEPVGAPVGGPS